MSTTMNVRFANMHDIEANWNRCPNFIPAAGEIIVYDADETHIYQRFKVGDGKTTVMLLPFMNDPLLNSAINWEDDVGYIDSGNISDY